MISSADEHTANLKFVEIIRKHAMLYNFERADYWKRDVTDKAWEEVAKEVGANVSCCKDRWKNLRTSLARSLRKTPGSHRFKRHYYLRDAMEFVLPYMKYRVLQPDVVTSEIQEEDNESSNDQTEYKVEEFTEEDQNVFFLEASAKDPLTESSPLIIQAPKVDTAAEPSPKRVKLNTDEVQTEQESGLQAEADLGFLKSLLPDLSKMTDYQKRCFKRKTLELIDSIICDAPL